MNYFSFLYLLSGFLTFFLSVYILYKNKSNPLSKLFSLFSFVLSWWLLSSAGLLLACKSNDENIAILWDRIVYFGVVYIPTLILHLTIIFTKKVKQKKLLMGSYFLSVFFSIFVWTDYFIYGLFYFSWGCHTIAGPLHHFFVVAFSFNIILSFINLFSKLRDSNITSKEKFQAKNMIIALALFSFGGAGLLPAYGIDISPAFQLSGVVVVVLVAYYIVRYSFLDMKFVLRRSSVYLLSVSAVILLATGLKFIFSIFFSESGLLNELIIIFAAIFYFPYIKDFFSYISNKYFFSSLYNTQEVIARFSERLSTILDIEKLLEAVASEINKTFYPKSFSIFLFNEKDSMYYSAFNAGSSFVKRQVFDLLANPLKKYLDETNVLLLEELKERNLDDYNYIQKTFLNNDIKLVVPLTIKDRSVGLFLMGEKESGEDFNNEDIQLLQILTTQSAFALDNSLKYEEAKNFNILLEREVEAAVMDLRKANEELRKLDTAKSDFISIASHQLRTPLTVIKGYISMILEGNFGKLPDTSRESIEKIYDSNERLIKLVEQLLSISRIESGKIKYEFEKTNLSEIVLEVMESVRYGAIKKGLDLSYSQPKGFDPIVKIDSTKIRQVITSLIDNSIKYTNKTENKRGFILIRIEDLKKKEMIRFILEDNGMGIKEEDKGNLFKKFSRGADMSIVHTEGTGLGLYVAKQVIEAHRGAIYAESRGRDMGTKIYFDLPKFTKDE